MRIQSAKAPTQMSLQSDIIFLFLHGRKIRMGYLIMKQPSIIYNTFKLVVLVNYTEIGNHQKFARFLMIKSKGEIFLMKHFHSIHLFFSDIMAIFNVLSQCYAEFVLGTPEKPSQEIQKKDNPDEPGPINTNSYLVVKLNKFHNKVKGYPMSKQIIILESGDIIKLGKVEYSVVEIGGTKKKNKNEEIFLKQFDGTYTVDRPSEGNCKFCLCDDVTEDNILISPCKCKGSCEVVHLECLKMWISSKIKKQVNGVVASYNFAKFECELCKEPFPTKVINENKIIQMLQIDKPQKPYMILENINERKDSKEERCLHIISMQNGGVIKMGRGHQCQIRLQDISVSRTHTEIKFQDGQFFLIDNNSKFGTLVRINQPLELTHPVKLQIGRSLYQFSIQ